MQRQSKLIACQSIQHKRPYQEDRCASYRRGIRGHQLTAFAIFDGHGGDNVSDMLRNKLSVGDKSYSGLLSYLARNVPFGTGKTVSQLRHAIQEAIFEVDWNICQWCRQHNVHHGSTASIWIQYDKSIWVITLGDSRVQAFGSTCWSSRDHSVRAEQSRLKRCIKQWNAPLQLVHANGEVRLSAQSDSLNVCRGFGDAEFKPHAKETLRKPFACSAIANIRHFPLSKCGNTLWILASDGFWDQGAFVPPPVPGDHAFRQWVKHRLQDAKKKTFDNISMLMVWTP